MDIAVWQNLSHLFALLWDENGERHESIQSASPFSGEHPIAHTQMVVDRKNRDSNYLKVSQSLGKRDRISP